MSISNYLEAAVLNQVFSTGHATFSGLTTGLWVSLHTADPGETGTGTPLASCPRMQVTFASTTATGIGFVSNNATASVVASATGDVTHVALWDGSSTATANCLWTGALSATKTISNSGDTVTLAIGALTITLD